MSLPFKQSGGGFLNGVSGTIVSYQLDAKEWPAKKKGGDPYTTLSVELEILQDGADAAVQQFLQAGFIYPDTQSISDDGLTLESEDDKAIIAADTEFGRFLQSAVDAGFDESPLVEANLRNFECLLNQRFTFKREADKEGTEKFGKRKGKDGREYNRDFLLVSDYLGAAEVSKKAGKGTKKAEPAKAAKGGKTNGAAKVAEADALIEQGETVLLSILADNKDKDNKQKPLERTAISSKIVRYAVDNDIDSETREALRKLVGSEDFLSRKSGWSYDAKAKGQPVVLA